MVSAARAVSIILPSDLNASVTPSPLAAESKSNMFGFSSRSACVALNARLSLSYCFFRWAASTASILDNATISVFFVKSDPYA